MLAELAMTKAGMNTLSTVNLPAPVNCTEVPSSMKIGRSISIPICRRTGQSTTSVNAPWLAAAKAWRAPAVSSEVPVQDTQLPIDRLAAAAGACATPPASPWIVTVAPAGPPILAPLDLDNETDNVLVPLNGVPLNIGMVNDLGVPSPLAQLSTPFVLP